MSNPSESNDILQRMGKQGFVRGNLFKSDRNRVSEPLPLRK